MRISLLSRCTHIPWLSFLSVLCFMALNHANAAEITWTGTENASWYNPDNWDGGVPDEDDIVVITLRANQPEVNKMDTICGGLILEEGATVSVVDSGNTEALSTLYIIGPGDLDGDGISDITERERSIIADDFDADHDGIPNFAETDADDDGMSDACEFEYPTILDVYAENDPNVDHDGDGYTDAEECAAGSNPTIYDDVPDAIPVSGVMGLTVLCLALAAGSIAILRKTGKKTRRVLSILLAVALLASIGYLAAPSVLATTVSVDFALGQTIHGTAVAASPEDILEVNGGSVRPWNGGSTYVTKLLTVKAVGGTVFLGGLRADFDAGVLGQGSLGIVSDYMGADHPSAISEPVQVGSISRLVFLGERFTLTATPADEDWRFHGWSGDASGDTSPLSFQILKNGSRITAVFGPPGPDLTAAVDTGPPEALQADQPFAVEIRVENIGRDVAEYPWKDGLYLSRDAVFDAADFEFDVESRSADLEGGGSYVVSFSVAMPDVAPGAYYVLGVADKDRQIIDANRNNNAVAVGTVVLDANLAQ